MATKKNSAALMHTMPAEKRAEIAATERITTADYEDGVPVRNSTMKESYIATELNYRGKK